MQTGFFPLHDIIENHCTFNILCSLSKAEVFSVFLFFKLYFCKDYDFIINTQIADYILVYCGCQAGTLCVYGTSIYWRPGVYLYV